MVAGGFIAGLAFICSGVLEYELEQTYPMLPSKGEAFINFVNSLPCDLMITDSKGNSRTLSMGDMTTIKKIPVFNKTEYNVVLSAMDNCKNTPMNSRHMEISVPVTEREVNPLRFKLCNTHAHESV